jgi:alpha-L-fucosidase
MIKKTQWLAVIALFVVALCLYSCTGPDTTRPTAEENTIQTTNKPERLEWLKDAGFGMFIHWSVDSQLGCVINHSLNGASEDYIHRFYTELPKTFNPDKYNPEKWVVLAKIAGMKYVVFTAKHMAGFCMWDTKTTDYNIMNTPYGKDILAEYVKACRKHGLAVGLYFSPEDFNFLHENGYELKWFNKEVHPENNQKYLEFLEAQMRELLTEYGKIDVIFFDGIGSKPLKELVWKIDPDILVTRGAIRTPEQTLLGIPSNEAWEACVTMGTSWQYQATNTDYKSGTRLIEILIETRAKGGALLLNVGPKPDGELPIEQEERMREIAMWNFVNNEGIANVRPWIITNEDNIWYTRKNDTVYAFITKLGLWPRGERKSFILRTIKATEKTEVSVLGQSGTYFSKGTPFVDVTAKWNQLDDGLNVSVARAYKLYNNDKWPNPVVIKITNVKPALSIPVFETGTAEVSGAGKAILSGNLSDIGDSEKIDIGFQYKIYPGFQEVLYFEEWKETKFEPQDKEGEFKMEVNGLKKGTEYQYRVVLKHKLITIYGDTKRFHLP